MRLALHWKILIALALGVVVGVAINVGWTAGTWRALGVNDPAAFVEWRGPAPAAPGAAPGAGAGAAADPNADAGVAAHAARFAGRAAQFVGDLFIRALRFIAVPIVLFSLIVGVASLGDPRALGRIGGRTIGYFVLTTVIAAALGLTLANAIAPGALVSEEKRAEIAAGQRGAAESRIAAGERAKEETSIWQEVVDVVPANPFAAIAQAEMLQVVFAACAVGVGLTLIPRHKSEPVVRVLDGLQDAVIELTRLIMLAAPYAVFCLIARTAATLGLEVLGALLAYCLVVIVGLAVALFGMYPATLYLLTPRARRVGFRRFFSALAPAQLLAFSSSSSSATLPVTMECTRDRLGVAERVVSFVVPLGATTNMAGTALYQAVASTFIAQLYGVELGLAQQATIVLLATLIAVGSPGVPGGSIVMMVIVLEAVGLPTEGIAVILAVDRVLDMCRTVVNVSGDAAAAAVVGAWERDESPGTPGGITESAGQR